MANFQDNRIPRLPKGRPYFHQGTWEDLPDPESKSDEGLAWADDEVEHPITVHWLEHKLSIHSRMFRIEVTEVKVPENVKFSDLKYDVEEIIKDSYWELDELEFEHLSFYAKPSKLKRDNGTETQ